MKFINFKNDWPFYLIFSISFFVRLIQEYYVSPLSFNDPLNLFFICLGSATGDMLPPFVIASVISLIFKLAKTKFPFYCFFVVAWVVLIIPFHYKQIEKGRNSRSIELITGTGHIPRAFEE